MVPADAAGVMFTANPANGNRQQTVISAAWGLGEAVVSGQVNTDDWVLDRTGRIRSVSIAAKTVRTVVTDTGTTTVDLPAELVHAASLSNDRA